jgi:hypothetical protein
MVLEGVKLVMVVTRFDGRFFNLFGCHFLLAKTGKMVDGVVRTCWCSGCGDCTLFLTMIDIAQRTGSVTQSESGKKQTRSSSRSSPDYIDHREAAVGLRYDV